LIWTLSKLGLARNLRKSQETRVLSLMLKEHKEALIDRIKNSFIEKKDAAEEKVNKFTEGLSEKLANLQALAKELKDAKHDKLTMPASVKKLSSDIKRLKKSLRKDWREWRRFSKSIMKVKVKAA
jgi:stearoyl-CoA desaturase (delta-9 desaturase)